MSCCPFGIIGNLGDNFFCRLYLGTIVFRYGANYCNSNIHWRVVSIAMILFSDNRFVHLFTTAYRRMGDGFSLGFELKMELKYLPSYIARSKIECSLICYGMTDCDGINYSPRNFSCHVKQLQSVWLPWNKPFSRIDDCINYREWDGITYPFPNFNGCTTGVREWISNFIPHWSMDVLTYLCWD